MSTKELQLANFEQAKKLKELGFDWETEEFYHDDGTADIRMFGDHNAAGKYSAPTIALALKWFRDKKGLKNEVRFYYCSSSYEAYYYQGCLDCKTHKHLLLTSNFDTYEAAESALLDELLSILEKEKEQ